MKSADSDDLSTAMQHRFDPSAAPETAFTLVVIEGADSGMRVVLDGSQASRVFIGQSPACEIRISDREVSRRHASFEWVDGRLKITDAGSRNGTMVDHLAIGEVFLAGGEIVRLGSTAFRVETSGPASPPSLASAGHFGRMIGASREMARLYPLCQKLAASNVPVIIEGETGTGKEVLAEALHEGGPRANGPFVVFDCAAIPKHLAESELFGHEAGMGPDKTEAARKGIFEQAHGGTLLFDEIGELDLTLQPKLLRAIEKSEVRPMGSNKAVAFDVRILASTRHDLDKEVQSARFRDDLFHRLAGARIELPKLQSRRGDVPILAQHFCVQLGGHGKSLPRPLVARWEDQAWPGNVRELRQAVARHLALGDYEDDVQNSRVTESLADVEKRADPAVTAGTNELLDQILAQGLPLVEARRVVIEAFEKRYIEHVLAQHGGNVIRAAAASGIGRRYFQIMKARLQE